MLNQVPAIVETFDIKRMKVGVQTPVTIITAASNKSKIKEKQHRKITSKVCDNRDNRLIQLIVVSGSKNCRGNFYGDMRKVLVECPNVAVSISQCQVF